MSHIINRSLDTEIGPKFLAINTADLIRTVQSVPGIGTVQSVNPARRFNSNSTADKLLLTADLPDLTVDLPALGGMIRPFLWLRNSNEGDAALQVGVGLFRYLCTNGLYLGMNTFLSKIRHTDSARTHGALDALPAEIQQAIEALASGAAFETAHEASQIAVSNPIEVVAQLPQLTSKAREQAIMHAALGTHRTQDDIRTAWGLYQLVNEVSRRAGRSQYRTAVNDIGLLDDIVALAGAPSTIELIAA